MPDTTIPPLPPGKDSSEFSLTRLFAIIAGLFSLLLPLLAALTTFLDGLQALFPGGKWIAAISGGVGSLFAVALLIGKFISGRTDVKVAHLEASARAGQLAAGAITTEAQAADAFRR